MKHTAQDFAQAEFARHPETGTKAMRREGVRTDEPWYFLVGNAIHRRSDEQMARDDWTIVGSVPNDPQPTALREPYDLKMFQEKYGLRHDWHEPDDQGIGARIIGTHLDNAMGSSTRFEGESHCEFNVVLQHMAYDHDTNDYDHQDMAVVNLATLLAWAAEHGACQR